MVALYIVMSRWFAGGDYTAMRLPKALWAFASFLPRAILRPRKRKNRTHGYSRTQSENAGRGMHGRHARGLRRDTCVSRSGGLAEDLRGDGDAHQDQAAARAQR